MNHQYVLWTFVFALGFGACTSGADDGSSMDADVQAITDLRTQEIAAAEAGSVEELLALRTEDFVAMPPGQPPVHGQAEVRAFLQQMFDAVTLEETVTSEEVVVAGDWAYDRGTFTGTATIRETGDAIEVNGKYLWVVERQPDGSWKYSVQMWSDNQPPAG